jgi:hypothetical protein
MKSLEKFVFLSIIESLDEAVLTPNGISLWITDPEIRNWYFEYRNDGSLLYNSIFFHKKFRIFSLKPSEISSFLKKWFEKHFSVMIRNMIKKNSDMDYELDKIRKKREDWDLKKRYGFTYETIKKYSDIRLQESESKVRVKNFISL